MLLFHEELYCILLWNRKSLKRKSTISLHKKISSARTEPSTSTPPPLSWMPKQLYHYISSTYPLPCIYSMYFVPLSLQCLLTKHYNWINYCPMHMKHFYLVLLSYTVSNKTFCILKECVIKLMGSWDEYFFWRSIICTPKAACDK